MQTQIGGTVALIVAVPFGLGMLTAAIIATTGKRESSTPASDVWDAVKLRGGVTARSPWHSSESAMNTPGLVEVRPRRESEPCTSTLPIPFPAPVPVNPDSQPLRNVAATAEQGDRKGISAIDETNREVVIGLVSQGVSKTKIIRQIWGCSPGGSQKYKDARSMYEAILSEVSANA